MFVVTLLRLLLHPCCFVTNPPPGKIHQSKHLEKQCCGSGSVPLELGSGPEMEKKIRIRDEHPGSYFPDLKNNLLV
jgi:hypothetical protein